MKTTSQELSINIQNKKLLQKKKYDKSKKGIQDVTPKSTFLNWCQCKIKDCKIPIWAIGGRSDYYRKVFFIFPCRIFFFFAFQYPLQNDIKTIK